MWLQDLEKAIKALRESEKYQYTCFKNAMPCWDGGICFETTYFTFVKWFPNGTITEHHKDDWRK